MRFFLIFSPSIFCWKIPNKPNSKFQQTSWVSAFYLPVLGTGRVNLPPPGPHFPGVGVGVQPALSFSQSAPFSSQLAGSIGVLILRIRPGFFPDNSENPISSSEHTKNFNVFTRLGTCVLFQINCSKGVLIIQNETEAERMDFLQLTAWDFPFSEFCIWENVIFDANSDKFP